MQRAVNPQTGEVLFLIDNQWKKPEQTAINPETGERAFLVNNQWEIMPAFQPPEPVGEVQADTFEQTPEEMITPLPERPTQALEAPEPTALESVANVFKRQKATYRDVATSYLTQTGVIDPTDAAFLLKENARRRGAAAPSMAIQEGMAAIAGAESYGDAVNAMLKNPGATFTMLVDSIVTSLPLVAPGLVLAPAGAVAAGTAAALGSGGLEYGAVMTDVLQDKGIDISDPFAVTRALENPEIMGEIKEKGAKRGLIIGAFDGISVGLAGRFLNPTMDLIQAGKLTGNEAKKAFYANTAKELTTQTALGAGGEFAAQVATGEDRPADVLLEGLAGLATAPLEVAASRRQAAVAEEAAAQPPAAPPAAPAAPRVEPTLGPTPPAPAAVTPTPTPPAPPEEEIVPFAQGEFEGEPAPPAAQREPIEEPPQMFGKPAPVSEDELARRREMKALEKEQRTLGAPTKEQNMFSVLKGKLDKKSLTDLGLDLSPSRIRQLSAPKTERGRRLEEVIGDGELDEFLPFGLRLASMPPDASADDMLDREQAAFEYMIDKLAKDDPLSYEASVELRRIGYELDQLQQEGRLDEINRELQAIADEELLARTEAAAVAPEERGIVGAEGAPGTEAARQAAQQAGIAPSLFGEEEAKEPAARIKAGLTRYASGMSGLSDLETGAYTRAGYGRNGIGVDVSLLSTSATDALANAILNYRTPAFIDSGAFSAFRKQIKGQPVDPIDFDRVLAKYDEILQKIDALNPEERRDYPRPRLVMPDVVGDQDASVDLVNRYKNWIATEIRGNLSDPIVPIQKGPRSLSEVYDEISNILGTRDFIVGVPSQEEAISKADLTEFLKTSQPPKIHFLGAASDKKLNPLLALVAQHSPNTEVSADASKVRSSILGGVAQGKTREQAIQDALRAEDDPYEVFNRYMEQASATAVPEEGVPVVPIEASEEAFGEALEDASNIDDERVQELFDTKQKPAKPKPTDIMSLDQAKEKIQSWKDEAARQGATGENANRTVLSLFDVSGEWSKPWREAGYNVVTFDIQTGQDIKGFDAATLLEEFGNENIWGIIAAPPCTDFASSGAQYWSAKDADGRTKESNELVRQVLRTVELFRPAIWAMENPVGRIARLNDLPPAQLTFQPSFYGDPYTKKTLLWGNFNNDLPMAAVEPTEGSKIAKISGKDKYARSLTPEGFAYSFFMANNAAGMSPEMRLSREFHGITPEEFMGAGNEAQIRDAISDDYFDNNLEQVRATLRSMKGAEPAPQAAPAAESDVDKLAEAFPNVPREQFEGVGSFAKVKPYIQAAYNKGNLKQIETILNSLRKAAPPVVREPQKEIEITKTPREFYMEMIPAAGFKRLESGDPRRYKNKSGEEFLTFERDGVRIAVKGTTILYADARGVGMYMGEGTDLLLQAMIVDDSARRQGRATKAMQDILSLADQAGMTTYIEPVQITKDVGMSTDQLKAFYKRFGFEPQKTEPATDRVMVREPQKPKAVPEEKRLADLERDLFRLTPPPTPERGAPRAAQADLFGAAGLESLPPAPELAKKKRQNNQQLSLFGSEVIDQSENNTAGRKARKAAIDEVKAMQETDTPMGLSFADEFAQKQRANLVGQKINSAADLAVLSQVYRDPKFETFRLFFTDGENNIISQLGVTSRLPGSSNAIIGNDLNKYLVEVQKAAKDVGAVGFWMLHNHPSGNVQSSRADILLTKTFNKYMPGLNLLGHVIIDTNKYGFIRSDGTYTEVSKDMGQKDLVEFQNGAYSDFFKPIEIAKRVDENPDSMVLIVMNNGLDVTGITTLPNSDFIGKTPEQVKRTLMKTALRNMGSRMLVASRNRDALKAVGPVVEDGIYIKDNGQYERFNQMFAYRTVLTFPLSRPGVVTADSSKLFDFLRKPKIAEPGRSKYLNWQDLRVLEPKEDLFGAQTLAKVDSLPKDKSKLPPGRSPELAELTERFARGEISRAERDEAVEKYKKVRVWEEPLEPASEEAMRNALNVVQRQKVDAPIPDGTKVGTRIDIEAARKGVSVVTIHEAKPKVTSPAPGSPISYRSVAKLKNVQFAIGSEKKAFEIAKGRKKDALQTMEGNLVNITPAEAKREMEKALSDPEYIQIGLDPTAHSYFFDRVTKLPVISADEVIQIGSQVLAKGVEFQESETFLFNITDDQGHLFEGEGFEKLDKVPAGVKKKVKKGVSPELSELAVKLKNKEITRDEWDDAVDRYSKIELYAEPPKPATISAIRDAIDSNKLKYVNIPVPDGTRVGLRLDIRALDNHGVGVVSVHRGKPSVTSPKALEILSYMSVAGLKNVQFAVGDQNRALDMAIGMFKDKLQTMEGSLVNYTPEAAYKKMQEVFNDPEWIQLGTSPRRHAYFYDRLTTLPVVSAEEVLQIGPFVMAKGVEFGDKYDFLFDIGNPTARTDKEVKDAIKRDREEILGFYQGLRQRRAALVRKVEKGEVSINIQRRLNELNELAKEMQLEAKILYEPNLSARAFRNRAEKAFLDGDIEADVLGVVETMLAKYPGLLEGLQLSVKTDKTLKEAAGSFNPLKRMVNLYKGTSGTMKPMSIRHELSHAMEQMMPIGAREAMIREWSKAFQAAIKKHTDKKSQEYFQKVLEFLDRPSMARLQAATNAMPSYDFYQYLNPSEYWAVNAEKLMAAQLGTPWNRFVKAMKRLFEGMKKILGFNNKYATHKVFDQIISGSMKRLDRGSLLDYMLEGDTDIDFLMNVKDVDDLMAKYKRPDTPVESTEPVKDAFLGMGRTTKELAEEMRERPLAPVSRMASNIDRAITYARNKNIWFGTGLNQADFKRYNGKLKDGHDQVVASIAVDNALHAGHVGVQVAMLGKLKYDTKIGMFTAAKAEKSMQNVIKLKAKLVDQLGLQRAVNVINGYLEAKRSRSIINEYLQREANYEQALAGGDLAGPSPTQIAEAKEELASIEKAMDKVLMSDEEIDDFIALEDQYPELREILDNWTAVNRNLLDNMYFAGILSKGRYDKLKAIKDYVPWYRITDDMEDIHKPTAGAIRALTDVAKEKIFRKGVPKMTREAVSSKDQQDFDIRVNPDAEVFVDNNKIDKDLYEVKEDRTLRFKTPLPEGMTVKVIQDRPIDDMIDNMLNNVLMTTKNVMRNYAALKVVNAYGTRNEKGKLRVFPTEGTDENGVRFNILANGKRIVVQIKDPLIAESVLGLENLELPVNGILSYFANGFRRSITVFPAFQLKQLFMDAPGAAWVSGVKQPFRLWGKVFSSFLATLNPNDPITQILRSKGIGGFQSAFRSPQKELELEIGLVKGNMFAQAMKVLDKIGDASDIAQRRAIYMQIMKETGDETLALSMAQNVIDFLRRGSGRPAQFVTRTVSFAGAYAQSIDVLARTLAGGGLKGMDRKRALAQMIKTGMMLSAVTVLYSMAVGDDEEYQKLDDQTKFRGFFIPGSKEVFGETLVLPMATGASFFFKTLPEIAYNQIMREGTESEMDETRLRKALSTAALDSLLGPNMTPTAVKPFIEIALNRNFFTGTNLIPRSMEDLEAAEQYNATTSELGKVVSNLTSVPGTEKRLLAPIEADHLMRSLFGTVAATAMWGSNLLVEDRIDARMKDNPLYGPFFLPPVGRGREDLFYDLKDRVDKKYRTYQTMLERDADKADEYLEKHEDLIDMYPYVDTTARVLSELNSVARLVGTSSDLGYTKKERTEDLRAIQEEKNDILEEITQLRKEAGL